MPAVGRPDRPKSLVEHLSEQAPKRAVNDIVSIDRYMWSARLLLNQATEYRLAGEDEQLYVILLRYASLVVETIPKHRDFRSSSAIYTSLKRDLLERYLPELERLKASLRLKDRPEPPAAASRNRPADAVQLSVSSLPQLDWASSGAPTPSTPPPPPPPGTSAYGLQVEDLLDVVRGGPPAGSSQQHQEQAYTRDAGAVGPVDPYALAALAASSAASPGVDMPKYSTTYSGGSSGRHALFGSPGGGTGDAARAAAAAAARGAALPRYPAVEGSSSAQAAAASLTQLSLAAYQDVPQPSAGPSLGPQEVQVVSMSASTAGLPDTCTTAHAGAPPPPPPPPQPSAPPAPPPASAPASGGPKELVKRAQMRDVHVSVALMEEFLHYARANTARGIESCGILAGKLLAGDSTFAITTLIIPKQQGTSDTVQALNEEEIFEAQFARELYPMGWIHTHPTQTCFLSSVDVHTQCGYQTMLDEAVAIVMAPSDASKRCGIFRLSTPGGLGLVQKCAQRGFHMHPPTDTGQELYELCGHVFLNPRTRHEVLDLR